MSNRCCDPWGAALAQQCCSQRANTATLSAPTSGDHQRLGQQLLQVPLNAASGARHALHRLQVCEKSVAAGSVSRQYPCSPYPEALPAQGQHPPAPDQRRSCPGHPAPGPELQGPPAGGPPLQPGQPGHHPAHPAWCC